MNFLKDTVLPIQQFICMAHGARNMLCGPKNNNKKLKTKPTVQKCDFADTWSLRKFASVILIQF